MSSTQVQNSAILFDKLAVEAGQVGSERARFERLLTAIERLADAAAVGLAVLLAYGIYRHLPIGRHVTYSRNQILIGAVALGTIFVILLDRDGAYLGGNSLLRIRETERALRVSMEAFLLVFPLSFFSAQLFSRLLLVLAAAIVPFCLVVQKQLLFKMVRGLHARGYGLETVLIYGAGDTGRRVFSALTRSPKLGLLPAVMVDDDAAKTGEAIFEYAYHHQRSVTVQSGPLNKDLIAGWGAKVVVIAIPSLAREKFVSAVSEAASAQARVMFVPNHGVPSHLWTNYADIDGLLLTSLTGPDTKSWYECLKRAFDLLAATLLLAVTTPLLLLIAIVVRLDSKGPVFFRQERAGKNGNLFPMYKFRSMYIEAPVYGYSPKESQDPRITRVGRWLRQTSLDELPQIFNVLQGHMSLVGPRPEMPFIVARYTPLHRQRLAVKPGITGLWQISADRALLIHENIEYDLYYLRNRNLFLDFAILLHTAVFAVRGV